MKKALTKALSAGWDPKRHYRASDWAIVTSRPDFWQALARALKWDNKVPVDHPVVKFVIPWLAAWHGFIDHLVAEKKVDEYFEALFLHN